MKRLPRFLSPRMEEAELSDCGVVGLARQKAIEISAFSPFGIAVVRVVNEVCLSAL